MAMHMAHDPQRQDRADALAGLAQLIAQLGLEVVVVMIEPTLRAQLAVIESDKQQVAALEVLADQIGVSVEEYKEGLAQMRRQR